MIDVCGKAIETTIVTTFVVVKQSLKEGIFLTNTNIIQLFIKAQTLHNKKMVKVYIN